MTIDPSKIRGIRVLVDCLECGGMGLVQRKTRLCDGCNGHCARGDLISIEQLFELFVDYQQSQEAKIKQ